MEVGIGILGAGVVGGTLAAKLIDEADAIEAKSGLAFDVRRIGVRDLDKPRPFDLPADRLTDRPTDVIDDPRVRLVVELMGGLEPAGSLVERALSAGKPVVTANKAVLARHGVALARTAERHGATILFEAAVAGGIPAIKTLREALAANRIDRVWGILNGTCNYILTRMEAEGLSFRDCLAEAQRLGYAEADPSFDIDGHDSAHKLALLAALAFGSEVDLDAIHLEGIASITEADLEAAEELGYRIKLVGVARRTPEGIEQRVTPTMIPRSAPMAGVGGVLNAVAIDGDAVGEIMLVGPGAGGGATASAVLADVIDIARGNRLPTFALPAESLAPARRARLLAHEGSYYIRLSVFDRPGAFAGIAGRMAGEGISLESIVQKGHRDGRGGALPLPVVLITHETTEDRVRRALTAIERDGHIDGPPQMIRIETP